MNMTIPAYPVFRPIELDDKEAFDAAFAASPPENSEYTFTNLYSWRVQHGFHVSRMDDLLILASEQDGSREYYPPIGAGDVRAAIRRILAETRGRFVRVPENMVSASGLGQSVKAVEDRDNADYVFLARDLIELKGRRYDAKRNFIKNFKSSYQCEYIQVKTDDVRRVLQFQDVWCVERGCGQSASLQDEADAVRIMLSHIGRFPIKTGALAVEGKICAVCIAEALNPQTLVIHALKGAHLMTGIYPVIFNEFLIREAATFRYINMEQDLGIPGLRKSKESYHPVRLVRKFSLSLNV